MDTLDGQNRFDDFFKDSNYVALKNSLYNYRLRKAAIARQLRAQPAARILETGSGLSPVTNRKARTVFTDLSFEALAILRQINSVGTYVVADCCNLPFKDSAFACILSSEVIEHIADDRQALREMARVMLPCGRLIMTFPHRKCYFAADDRFVDHFRRYEIQEMREYMESVGIAVMRFDKLLGPLEKMTMLLVVTLYRIVRKKSRNRRLKDPLSQAAALKKLFSFMNALFIIPVWWEARLLPLSFATVVMVVGARENLKIAKRRCG